MDHPSLLVYEAKRRRLCGTVMDLLCCGYTIWIDGLTVYSAAALASADWTDLLLVDWYWSKAVNTHQAKKNPKNHTAHMYKMHQCKTGKEGEGKGNRRRVWIKPWDNIDWRSAHSQTEGWADVIGWETAETKRVDDILSSLSWGGVSATLWRRSGPGWRRPGPASLASWSAGPASPPASGGGRWKVVVSRTNRHFHLASSYFQKPSTVHFMLYFTQSTYDYLQSDWNTYLKGVNLKRI